MMSSIPKIASRLPTAFLSHGGGPCFYIESDDPTFSKMDTNSDFANWYRQLSTQLKITGENKPKAILMVSAHWESAEKDTVYVTSQKTHRSLYYDYGGFPKEMYSITYPSPGSPELAKQVVKLVKEAKIGLKVVEDTKRNLDHGAFNPLHLLYPLADIPVVQLSILSSYNPLHHLQLGVALAPLRDQGILILGSGDGTHNFGGQPKHIPAMKQFISKITSVLSSPSSTPSPSLSSTLASVSISSHPTLPEIISVSSSSSSSLSTSSSSTSSSSTSSESSSLSYTSIDELKKSNRWQELLHWDKFPGARVSHPREDHFVPLFVIAGAAGLDKGTQIYDGWCGAFSLACWNFQ